MKAYERYDSVFFSSLKMHFFTISFVFIEKKVLRKVMK